MVVVGERGASTMCLACVRYCFVDVCGAGSCGGNTTPLLGTVHYPKVVWRAIVLWHGSGELLLCSAAVAHAPSPSPAPPATVARKLRRSEWPMPPPLQTLIVSVSRPLYR